MGYDAFGPRPSAPPPYNQQVPVYSYDQAMPRVQPMGSMSFGPYRDTAVHILQPPPTEISMVRTDNPECCCCCCKCPFWLCCLIIAFIILMSFLGASFSH